MTNPINTIKSFIRSRKNAARAGNGWKTKVFNWLQQISDRKVNRLSDASFDVFTYHGEDGIILYLLKKMQNVPSRFLDIGAGDGIKGNCTNLAVHFGWTGVFIDHHSEKLATGWQFYEKVKPGNEFVFLPVKATPGSINKVIVEAGAATETGLLSIDIDGNDYWLWQAITVIRPRIVVIEAKVEFGFKDVIVPYGETNSREHDLQYNGASVEALRRLGAEKGYKLVGANKQGYNLFFVQEAESIPAITTETLLNEPGIKKSFYPESFFATHTFAG